MKRRRESVPAIVQQQVYQRQQGRCALCATTNPVEMHHVISWSQGGADTDDNLVLLCRNHHDLADSGVISPELLGFYKQIASSEAVSLGHDPAILYEMTADQIVKQSLVRFDSKVVTLALNLLARLRRYRQARYKRIALELIFAVTYTSMHQENVNIEKLKRLEAMAKEICAEGAIDGDRYLQLISHYMGVALHNSKKYSAAKQAFTASAYGPPHENEVSRELAGDRFLARVSLTATEHLTGESARAYSQLNSVIDELPEKVGPYANAYVFARVKMAEHMLERRKYVQAEEILTAVVRAAPSPNQVGAIYGVIAVKDLARTYYSLGERERAVRLFVRALALAESSGFLDQVGKIRNMARQLGIKAGEIEAM